jgi:hypothetical protein
MLPDQAFQTLGADFHVLAATGLGLTVSAWSSTTVYSQYINRTLCEFEYPVWDHTLYVPDGIFSLLVFTVELLHNHVLITYVYFTGHERCVCMLY